MNKGPIITASALVFLASVALAPVAVAAGRFPVSPVGGRAIVRARPFVSRPFVPHLFFPRPFFHRHFFRPFIPFAVIVPPVVYAAPPVFYAPPTSYDPPAGYGPSPSGAVSIAPPPPPPSVIDYPAGRYELRGDGLTTPYAWVWIPKPPPPPPAPPVGAPALPQGAPDDPSGRPIERQSPAPSDRLYRWIDDDGVTHWTNMPNAIPERHRSKIQRPARPDDDHV